jgi:hypothetical protein
VAALEAKAAQLRSVMQAGIRQTVAMKMTGHKTDSVFRRYDIVSDLDLKDAARRDEVLQTELERTSCCLVLLSGRPCSLPFPGVRA